MKPLPAFALILLTALVTAWATVKFVTPAPTTTATAESVYDRVMRTGTIRCGYTPYSVGLIKDANTGELSGIYYEVVNELAALLGLEVNWAEEIGWGEQIEALNTNRFDLICSPVSITGPRSRAADFTAPLFYSPVYLWQRADAVYANLNAPQIKVATIDGEQTAAMAERFLPNAETVSLPQNSDFSQLMLNVVTGKADVTFAEPTPVFTFNENNPELIQAQAEPISLVPNILLLAAEQPAFKAMLNNGLSELFLNGTVDRIIDAYEEYPNSYIRSAGYY